MEEAKADAKKKEDEAASKAAAEKRKQEALAKYLLRTADLRQMISPEVAERRRIDGGVMGFLANNDD